MRHRTRQERWLHTRISEDLEEALKREARRRRTPVSLLVRNVLEGALDLVEDIVEDSLEIARRSGGLGQRIGESVRRVTRPDDVYGWQALILNRDTGCGRCGAALASGAEAYRGLRDRPGPPVFICPACIGRLREPTGHGKENAS